VNEVIERLKTLQDVLSEKYRVENELRDIPKSLSTKQELLDRLKKQYIEKNQEYESTKRRLNDIRLRMEEAEREREQYEQQMGQIKTQREYEALDKEIQDASDREQTLRRELQREEKVLEEMRHSLEREESMISEQEKELEEEQSRIESDKRSKEDHLANLAKQEKELTPGLDEELLFKFDRIIRSKEGEGIVPLRKGVCSGCNMILPRQFVNEVRQGQDIKFCLYCSKIVFFAEDEAGVASEDETEAFMEGLADEDTGGLADLVGVESELAELEDEGRVEEAPLDLSLTDEDEDDHPDEEEDSLQPEGEEPEANDKDSDEEEEEEEEEEEDQEPEDMEAEL